MRGTKAGDREVTRSLSEIFYLYKVYQKTDLGTILHVFGRWVLCPFSRVLEHIPDEGVHLDVGCGHGLLLALLRRRDPGRILRGMDISSRKIEQARRAILPGIDFEAGDIRDMAPDSVDSISVVDVLYLLPTPQKLLFLRACHDALRRDGKLMIKEVSKTSGWKSWITFLQELVSVKVLRITQGEEIRFLSTKGMALLVVEAGFPPPEVREIGKWYPYAHTLFFACKS
jgi:2-polyprenyl-6-hydroxyphenyl methylase/3-demethylubiquinone-9 3-methyltransferase